MKLVEDFFYDMRTKKNRKRLAIFIIWILVNFVLACSVKGIGCSQTDSGTACFNEAGIPLDVVVVLSIANLLVYAIYELSTD